MPVLSSAEFGYSIDTQQLYIGGGTVAEGAPQVGNVQILTENSDLFAIASAYTYEGSSTGYIVQTGPTVSQPVQRTLQAKLDDIVDVKDFGAMGDGTTNDTAAINRALFQLYCRYPANTSTRRKLYFPAGTYVISGNTVNIPTYASIFGAGKGKTIILQTDHTQTAVARLADSLQQVDVNIGSNGAITPQSIDIDGVSFQHQYDQPVLDITAAQFCNFTRCSFSGPLTLPATNGNGNACIEMASFAAVTTTNIDFSVCDFYGLGYGFLASDDMRNINVTQAYFHDLFQGLNLGQNTNGIAPAIAGPFGVTISNSLFDKVANIGLNVYNLTNISSEFNLYRDVGNANLGIGNPISYVISFNGKDNISFGDTFLRPDSDNATWARVFMNNNLCYYMIPHFGTAHGLLRSSPGNSITLNDNMPSPTDTTIALFTNQAYGYLIDYSIIRGTASRTGTLVITITPAGQSIQDNGLEAGGGAGTTGVVFSLTALSGTEVDIAYTTTSTGTNANLIYAVRRLTPQA